MMETFESQEQTKEKPQQKNLCRTVKELEAMTLMGPMSDRKLHDCEYVTDNTADGILETSDPTIHRRGAICEENLMERKGLIKLLRKYLKLQHLQEYSLI